MSADNGRINQTFIMVVLAALFLVWQMAPLQPVYAGIGVPDSLLTGGYVNLGSAQTISGVKTFSGANIFTADQTFNDNVKLYFGTGQDANCAFDGNNLICKGPVGSTPVWASGNNWRIGGDGTHAFSLSSGAYRFDTNGTADPTLRVGSSDGSEVFIFDNATGTQGLVIDPTNQFIAGGTGSGDNLTLQSTTHATKGKIVFNLGAAAASEMDNGDTDTDITYIALRNASGTLVYIYPDSAGTGVTVSTTKP